MNKNVIYGYISVVIASRQSTSNANFKAYDKVATTYFPQIGCLSREQIVVEELFRAKLPHPEFDNLIQRILTNTDCSNPKGCVIISSFSDLGYNDNERKMRFETLADNDIGLYIIDAPQYSTVSWENLLQFSKAPEDRRVFSFDNSADLLGSRVGRIAKKIDPKFKAVYWGYECFYMSEKDVTKNTLYPVSKVTFHRLCDEYEKLPDYSTDEEIAAKKYSSLLITPKRNGSITLQLREMMVKLGAAPDLEMIRRECEKATPLTTMSAITYQRYYEKARMDRSTFFRICKETHIENWLENHESDWEDSAGTCQDVTT